MPIVRIELYSGRSTQQKADCARDVVEAVVSNLGATPDSTHVIFVDVEPSDWLTTKKISSAKLEKRSND